MLRTILALAVTVTLDSAAQPVSLVSTIAEIHLFKNGLAAIRRTADLPEPGVYRIDAVVEPVHGTFWVSGPANITVRTALEEIEVPFKHHAGAGLQERFDSKRVTVFFREDSIPPVTGTVVRATEPTLPSWPPTAMASAAPDRFLVLEAGGDRIYVAESTIAYVNVHEAGTTMIETKPVLTLDAGEVASPATVDITYLVHGISWAPAYRVDISSNDTLTIAQQAVIKNELEDITGANIALVSGFPGIEFARVTSPLSAQVSWSQFFMQLQQRSRGLDRPDVTMQQAVISNSLPSTTRPT